MVNCAIYKIYDENKKNVVKKRKTGQDTELYIVSSDIDWKCYYDNSGADGTDGNRKP